MASILLFSPLVAQKLQKMIPSEISYKIFNRKIAAICWKPNQSVTPGVKVKPALALHGWLDNAASFSVIAPCLKRTELRAIDLAGQGRSDFRSADAGYDLISDLRDLYELTKVFEEGPIDLVGHSRGAIVAALFAAIVPEKVNRLVLIDSIEPFSRKLSHLPQDLADSLRGNSSLSGRSGTLYETQDAALVARMQSQIPVSRQSAKLLAERSLHKGREGWVWNSDQRLKAASGYRITDEMRSDFFSLIQAPTLVIEPEQGMLKLDPRFKEAGAAIPNITRKTVPGGHHCHMDDCPEMVAELTENWFDT